jgi:hypothetical protein
MNAIWPDIYRALFGRLIDDAETQAWQALLDVDFAGRGVDGKGRWTPDELIAALRSVSEDRRRVGTKGRAPEYAEVKTHMIRARMEARQANEMPGTGQGCGLCGGVSGMLLVFPDLPDDTGGIYAEANEYSKSVPCRCAVGNRRDKEIRSNPKNEIGPDVAHRIESLRWQATRQAQSRQRAAGAPESVAAAPAYGRDVGIDDDL